MRVAIPEDLPPEEQKFKGYHALLWFLGFFGVMFAVNGVFLYNAITSFPGEDVRKSYVQGLTYNDTLDARARQSELGWRAAVGLEDEQLVFALSDASNAPLSSMIVSANVRRSATQSEDRTLELKHAGNGRYSAQAGQLLPGQWDVRIEVFEEGETTPIFEARKTLFVQ